MNKFIKWLLVALLIIVIIIFGVPAVMMLFGLFMMFKEGIFE